MKIVLIELFSGIGGFAKGLQDAGFTIDHHYFSEIDKHAIANYKYNFPNAEHIGSVTNVSGRELRAKHPTDKIIITFGWPCQDNSLAGKRKGQRAGTRSGLLFEAGRIIDECRPQTFIAENVKGLYSVNKGVDFYEAVRFLTYLNSDSPQYTVEMQLLNTAWLLPQNRERTYFVGHIGTAGIKRIFPITENDCGSTEGAINATIVRTLTGGGNSGGMHSSMTLLNVSPTTEPVVVAQRGRYNEDGKTEQQLEVNSEGCANTLIGVQKDNMVIQLNPSTESGGKQPYQQNRVYAKEGLSPTLDQAAGKWQINTDNIRRLTEIECERLQGYPDNWTKYGNYDGVVREISRTQRYKLCGNAVTKNIVELIGTKLLNQ